MDDTTRGRGPQQAGMDDQVSHLQRSTPKPIAQRALTTKHSRPKVYVQSLVRQSGTGQEKSRAAALARSAGLGRTCSFMASPDIRFLMVSPFVEAGGFSERPGATALAKLHPVWQDW